MPPKKLKKFCGITKFIQQNDKDLHQALDDLCLFGLFRPRGRGVTFLYPSDKAYRKKITEHAYSNNPEKAVDMVRALVLLDYLPSPADFKNKKDDISNALHKKLEVESADANEVKLKSGHKLVIEATYKHLRDGDPVALYTMSGKGELPTTGTAATMKYNNTNPSTHKGGTVVEAHIRLTNCVESLYEQNNYNIYDIVVGLIYDYAIKERRTNLIYNKICASSRASFYNIIAPWTVERTGVIDEFLIKSGIQNMYECSMETLQKLTESHKGTYNEKLKALIDASGNGNTVKEKKDRDAILVIQQNLLKQIQNPIDARMEVMKAYASNQDRLYKDLLTVYCYLSTLNEINDHDYFKTTFKFVMKHVFNHNDSFKACNDTVYNLSIYYNLIKSDAFLYIPAYERSQISTDYKDLSGNLPNPNDDSLFTIQFSGYNEISKGITVTGGDDSFFGGIVNSL